MLILFGEDDEAKCPFEIIPGDLLLFKNLLHLLVYLSLLVRLRCYPRKLSGNAEESALACRFHLTRNIRNDGSRRQLYYKKYTARDAAPDVGAGSMSLQSIHPLLSSTEVFLTNLTPYKTAVYAALQRTVEQSSEEKSPEATL